VCRQKEIDGLPFLVDGTVEILPDALDLDVLTFSEVDSHSPIGKTGASA
jgi:hypothetical protein